MTCAGPSGSYTLAYDANTNTMTRDPAAGGSFWMVAVEIPGTISGLYGNDKAAEGFDAHFTKPMKVDYYARSRHERTDPCKPASN